MRTGQMGLLTLAFLTLLFTIPTAFAQVSGDNPALFNNANAKFVLMEKITDAQEEYDTLETLIISNGLNMGEGLNEYANALDMAIKLAEGPETLDDAAAILDDSEDILDDIYTQLEEQIDSRQNERFEDFVVRAESSIDFILTNADALGISQAVYDELEKTLAILQSGSYEEILAATSEESNLGLTASMFPEDHPGFGNASPNNNGKGKGLGLGDADNLPPGLQKLPSGIKKKYDISSDSNLGSQISDVSDETNGNDQTNGNDNSAFFDSLPGFGKSSENGQSNGKGQGVGLGVGPEAPGILKKDEAWLYDHGIIIDDSWKHPFEDDDFSKGKGQEKKGKGPPEDKGKSCKGGTCAQGQGNDQEQSDEPPGKSDEPPGKSDEPPGKSDEPPGKSDEPLGKGGGPPSGKNKNKP